MSTWYLLNSTTSGSTSPAGTPAVPYKLLAGTLVDDTKIALAPFQAQGALFWPSSDVVVAAAAAIAQKLAAHGQNEDTLDKVMLAGVSNSMLQGQVSSPVPAGGVKNQVFTLNLAQIQALTSGTAFNVGGALPTNAQLLGVYVSWTEITGGTLSGVHLIIGDATTNNSILTSTDVHGTLGPVNQAAFQNRSGAQIQATLTAAGDTLADATAGALSIQLIYSVL